jgi:hypothetical protein
MSTFKQEKNVSLNRRSMCGCPEMGNRVVNYGELGYYIDRPAAVLLCADAVH